MNLEAHHSTVAMQCWAAPSTPRLERAPGPFGDVVQHSMSVTVERMACHVISRRLNMHEPRTEREIVGAEAANMVRRHCQ